MILKSRDMEEGTLALEVFCRRYRNKVKDSELNLKNIPEGDTFTYILYLVSYISVPCAFGDGRPQGSPLRGGAAAVGLLRWGVLLGEMLRGGGYSWTGGRFR